MNKSILKHEFRSMKWMMLLTIIVSGILVMMFNLNLTRTYEDMFLSGHFFDNGVIKNGLENIFGNALVFFTGLSMIQVFMQFRSEKDQEIVRFLKSLPVKKEEFFKIKLSVGILNITLGFIFLALGLVMVRNNNMFWIKDLYSVSVWSESLIQLDGISIMLNELALTYLVVLSFYTFIFMIQYTFSNVVGGIVTGILVWMSPIFIIFSGSEAILKIRNLTIFESDLVSKIGNKIILIFPWSYIFDRNYGKVFLIRESLINNFNLKVLISIGIIIINIFIAYKFVEKSKVEDENKIIAFPITRQIFKLGVSVCSGLLLFIFTNIILGMNIGTVGVVVSLLIGGSIGYFISNKIANIGII